MRSEPPDRDAALLPRVAAGDPDAVRACVDRHGPLVLSMAKAWLGNEADAQDAVQEVFIELWRTAGAFDPRLGTERTWVATIARRRLIDRRRRRKPVEDAPLDESLQGAVEGTEIRSATGRERSAAVLQALAELSPELRRPLELSLLGGLSHSRIARETGVPLGTVKTHLRRGLERLRRRLAGLADATAGAPVGEVST